MSLASVVGGVLAYPINYWLVKSHLKHGCMTLPGTDGPATGLGHRSPEAAAGRAAHHGQSSAEGMAPMDPGMHAAHASDHADHGGGHHDMAMNSLPLHQSGSWVIGSFAMLLVVMWLTDLWVPISFAVGD
jgi:hypothetical protein